MLPGKLDLTIWRGLPFGPIGLLLKDSDGLPIDLTGVTPVAQIRLQPDGPLIAQFVASVPVAIEGRVLLSLIAGQTIKAPNAPAEWDMLLIMPGGIKTTPIIEGVVIFDTAITRP